MADNKRVKQDMNKLDVRNESSNTTIVFDREFLDKALPEAMKFGTEILAEDGHEEKDTKYRMNLQCQIEELDIGAIDGSAINLTLQTPYEEVYLNISVDITPKALEQMTELVIKRLNQAKALFQVVKK